MKTAPRAVVIGATGYIGSKLFAAAAQMGRVLGTSSSVASSQHTHLDLALPGNFVERNIRAEDIVYITAAISAPDVCASNPEWARQINVVGTGEIIEQALRTAHASFLARPDAPTVPLAMFRLLGRPGAALHGQAMALGTLLAVLTALCVLVIERLRPRDALGW